MKKNALANAIIAGIVGVAGIAATAFGGGIDQGAVDAIGGEGNGCRGEGFGHKFRKGTRDL